MDTILSYGPYWISLRAFYYINSLVIITILGSKYWVGQKVHLDFSLRCYGKSQTNLLANPILPSPPIL